MDKNQKLNFINKRIKELERIEKYDRAVNREVILKAKMKLMELELKMKIIVKYNCYGRSVITNF